VPDDGEFTLTTSNPQSRRRGFAPGTVIADCFKLTEELGRGGHGAVYLAEQMSVGRQIALKVLHVDKHMSPEAYERFRLEARQTCQLTHRNTVVCHDFGRDDEHGVVFMAMEFLEGINLRQLIAREGPLLPMKVSEILDQMAGSLAEAHEHNLIHRDLKPSNVMLVEREGRNRFVKVIDFGIAKSVNEKGQELSLTANDMVMGTPHYMAPEQIRNQRLDKRADVYALGVLVFEMLTGRRPFDAPQAIEVMRMHLVESTPQLGTFAPNQYLPSTLDAVLQKAMAKDKNERYETVTEFALAFTNAWQEAEGATSKMTDGQFDSVIDELGLKRPSDITPTMSDDLMAVEADDLFAETIADDGGLAAFSQEIAASDLGDAAKPNVSGTGTGTTQSPPWPMIGLVAAVIVVALIILAVIL